MSTESEPVRDGTSVALQKMQSQRTSRLHKQREPELKINFLDEM